MLHTIFLFILFSLVLLFENRTLEYKIKNELSTNYKSDNLKKLSKDVNIQARMHITILEEWIHHINDALGPIVLRFLNIKENTCKVNADKKCFGALDFVRSDMNGKISSMAAELPLWRMPACNTEDISMMYR